MVRPANHPCSPWAGGEKLETGLFRKSFGDPPAPYRLSGISGRYHPSDHPSVSDNSKFRLHVERKLKERSLSQPELGRLLKARLSPRISLERARAEWKRYLPADFQ